MFVCITIENIRKFARGPGRNLIDDGGIESGQGPHSLIVPVILPSLVNYGGL
jgi:hypothetical protein